MGNQDFIIDKIQKFGSTSNKVGALETIESVIPVILVEREDGTHRVDQFIKNSIGFNSAVFQDHP